MPLDPGTVEAAINGQMDRGDREAAVTEGIRAYGPQLLGYLVTVLRDVESAREVFAQVCENLWRGIAAFRRESTFRAWAYHVAYNAAQDHLRDPFRRRGRRLATEEVSKLIAAVPTPTPPAARTSVRGRIDALRAELSPDEQTLLTLRFQGTIPRMPSRNSPAARRVRKCGPGWRPARPATSISARAFSAANRSQRLDIVH